MHVLWIVFGWPYGICTGNLIASAIWAPLGLIHLNRLAKRRHEELKKHLGITNGD